MKLFNAAIMHHQLIVDISMKLLILAIRFSDISNSEQKLIQFVVETVARWQLPV